MTHNEDLLRMMENLAREARRLEGLGYHGRLLTILRRLKEYGEKVENHVRRLESEKKPHVP